MLTREQVLEQVKAGRKSQCLDGRDFGRLTDFFPPADWEVFGFGVEEGADLSEIKHKEWTRENVLAQLTLDVAFGFEKAHGQRGISSSFMAEVVKMWMWVLEDDVLKDVDYPEYGLPMFEAVAIKYGLPVD